MKIITQKNIHNLHFSSTKFFAEQWAKRNIFTRQIFYDSPYTETHFLLDVNSLELFLYFVDFGTRENPRIIYLFKLSEAYEVAITEIYIVENAFIRNYEMHDEKIWGKVETTAQLIKLLSADLTYTLLTKISNEFVNSLQISKQS